VPASIVPLELCWWSGFQNRFVTQLEFRKLQTPQQLLMSTTAERSSRCADSTADLGASAAASLLAVCLYITCFIHISCSSYYTT
jgi:hypothetical protein